MGRQRSDHRPRANLGSSSAAALADLIIGHTAYDQQFCRPADRRLGALAEPVCRFTTAMLEPPAPHVVDILTAATEHQPIADAFTANFADPPAMWSALASESGPASFITSALTRT